MPLIDRDESPFYAWLDRPTIRSLVREAGALAPGERMVLIKGLIPGLVEDVGEEVLLEFLEELAVKARRYAEAVANPGRGGAARTSPSERLGGPVPGPDGHKHLPGRRNPRRPGGRNLERQWEIAAWEELRLEASS